MRLLHSGVLNSRRTAGVEVLRVPEDLKIQAHVRDRSSGRREGGRINGRLKCFGVGGGPRESYDEVGLLG